MRKAIILGGRNFFPVSMQHVMLAIPAILFQAIFSASAKCCLGGYVSAHLREQGTTKDVRRAIAFFMPNILFSRTASGGTQVALRRQKVREMRQQLHSVACAKYRAFKKKKKSPTNPMDSAAGSLLILGSHTGLVLVSSGRALKTQRVNVLQCFLKQPILGKD